MFFEFYLWFITNLIAITIAQLCLTTIKCIPSIVNRLNPYVEFDGDDFVIEHDDMKRSIKAHTILMVIMLSFGHFFINDLTRMFNWDLELLLYPTMIFLTIPIFGFLGQVKGLQTSISNGGCKTLLSKIVFGSIGLLIVVMLFHEVYYAWVDDYVEKYVCSLIIGFLFHSILYVYVNTTKNLGLHGLITENPEMRVDEDGFPIYIHLHHWWIGYMVAFAIQSDFVYTNILFCIFYGVFVQGAITYGLDSIFVRN